MAREEIRKHGEKERQEDPDKKQGVQDKRLKAFAKNLKARKDLKNILAKVYPDQEGTDWTTNPWWDLRNDSKKD
ncbi:hypothetical protein [Pasteuria penetrans]|uniref:hypothetical protein n=1 Tax=Pasteuria penetrans TaxID=86005 RepID=UPI000FA7AE10|nr:hypothetical protein [Pasteuria penetrans]